MGWPKRQAKCCPDRAHYGKGLCSRCYQKAWAATKPAGYYRNYKNYRQRSNAASLTHWWKKVGINFTHEQYEALLAVQGGLCAICHKPPSGNRGHERLHVDHNHTTKQVRALLCGNCNRAIGLLNDEPAIAHALGDYLEAFDDSGRIDSISTT